MKKQAFFVIILAFVILCAGSLSFWVAPSSGSRFDVVVYGATPQGIAAAVTAAREGLRVALFEPGNGIGGVLVQGWLATLDLSHDDKGAPLQQGFFDEFYQLIGGENSFDVLRAERAFWRLLREAGVRVRLHHDLQSVLQDDGTITAVRFSTPGQLVQFEGSYFVDATDSAALAARAGALFTVGRSDTGLDDAQMAASLGFRLEGVLWEKLCLAAVRENREERTGSGCHQGSVWGFGALGFGYVPSDRQRFKLRGLNLAQQDDGSVLVNALWVYGVDGTDPASLEDAHEAATTELKRVVSYLRESDPELFGDATLVDVAPQLYIRESRHLLGLYRLGAENVMLGYAYSDGVAVGGYPLDGQVYLPGETPYLLGTPVPYEVPFRTLVPFGLNNLLVASQAASFDSTAAFSARVAPLQVALGQAAGVAAAVAFTSGSDFPTLAWDPRAMEVVRARLWEQGARLKLQPSPGLLPVAQARLLVHSAPSASLMDQLDPAFPYAVELLRRGLFSTPYTERGGLDLAAPMTIADFLANLIHFYRVNGTPAFRVLLERRESLANNRYQPLTGSDATEILRLIGHDLDLAGLDPKESLTRSEAALILWGVVGGGELPLDRLLPVPELPEAI